MSVKTLELAAKLRLGYIIFVVGTISNVGEFALAMTVQKGVMLPLILLMALDAAAIAYYFMHVSQIWHPEEH